eukprot:758457-Hanusia_phi.AAC.1
MLQDQEHQHDVSVGSPSASSQSHRSQEFPDVQEEEARVTKLQSADKSEVPASLCEPQLTRQQHDAVMIHQLKKIFPAYLGNPPKVSALPLTAAAHLLPPGRRQIPHHGRAAWRVLRHARAQRSWQDNDD